jgi:hypothetical protein
MISGLTVRMVRKPHPGSDQDSGALPAAAAHWGRCWTVKPV